MEMANADTRMSKMATHHLGITPASGPASSLQRQNTGDDVPEYYLATHPYHHNFLSPR